MESYRNSFTVYPYHNTLLVPVIHTHHSPVTSYGHFLILSIVLTFTFYLQSCILRASKHNTCHDACLTVKDFHALVAPWPWLVFVCELANESIPSTTAGKLRAGENKQAAKEGSEWCQQPTERTPTEKVKCAWTCIPSLCVRARAWGCGRMRVWWVQKLRW